MHELHVHIQIYIYTYICVIYCLYRGPNLISKYIFLILLWPAMSHWIKGRSKHDQVYMVTMLYLHVCGSKLLVTHICVHYTVRRLLSVKVITTASVWHLYYWGFVCLSHTYTHTYTPTLTHLHTHLHTCTDITSHTHTHTPTHTHTHTHITTHLHTCMYTYTHSHIYIYIYVHVTHDPMHLCIHIYNKYLSIL